MAATPAAADAPRLEARAVADGLEHPWALAFLPGGRYLVTEKPGRMRVIEADGRVQAPLSGLPAIAAGGQGGLLDVQLDSDFERNRTLYFCFSEPGPGGDRSVNSTALARARLSDDATRLTDVKVIFSQQPKYASRLHFGCRIAERVVDGKPDGTLFLALGERSTAKEEAQNLKSHFGKVVRVGKDGSVPADNPFRQRADALPEIWSWGHRNPQGAAIGPDGQLWVHEHGAQGGDEVNRPVAGRNYGWPVITHGVNYGGGRIGDGITAKDGMEQPLLHWTPSIAPSGLAFITSDRYGAAWKGQMVVGALKTRMLERLAVQDGRITARHLLLPELGQRVRDVREGPDGWLYLLTDDSKGQLMRIQPAAAAKAR
ncbi:PQQ-dependent sugar dehydrogenase [Comamonas endophytica]|uniref:PQQ-dependent sugar dehydrogenase n=1 Tax=Comamonas endophytica TaxID=2949090 RepID=A0ABY6GED3_9BURK|nr:MULTISPECIES: PQQ-dependent sugar dehydrogenase [unclassified Acidovorax]MCD2511991.1 PQQ-dependent sugar dehydrogenase [Acidovorax sp. D4N7]UYG53213.1 PQQ-dependent sugar dehydrogenase [Acidovorax sp. 5MLIR]